LDLLTDTIKAALFESDVSLEPNPGTDVYLADIGNTEVSGGGYARRTLSSKSVVLDNDESVFGCANLVFMNLSSTKIRHLIIFKDTGADGTSPIIVWFDRGSDLALAGKNLILSITANGLMRLI